MRSRIERRIDEEERIVRRCANENDVAAIDIGEKHVLLCLVEAVDLIDKQDAILSVHFFPVAGSLQNFPKDGNIGQYAAGAFEASVGCFGNHFGQCSFSASGRAIEDNAAEAVGLDGASQQFAFAENMLLPDDFIQGLRAHPRRQGGGSCSSLCLWHFGLIVEKIHKGKDSGLRSEMKP